MSKKILYEDFYKNKRIYNLNQGYWKRKLNLTLQTKLTTENVLFKNYDNNDIKIYDGNPIFTYLDPRKNRAIRIIQDNLDDASIYDLNNINVLISAWIDRIEISTDNSQNKDLEELVIALLLTEQTVAITIKLILKWLETGLNDQDIEDIIGSL